MVERYQDQVVRLKLENPLSQLINNVSRVSPTEVKSRCLISAAQGKNLSLFGGINYLIPPKSTKINK